MKGCLLCCGIDHDSTHDLTIIFEFVEREHALQESTTASIYNLARYDQRLRYKNLKSDPTSEDAQATIVDAMLLLDEFTKHPKYARFIGEAKEVHSKMLRKIDYQ
jgi:hypothetical protein